MLLSTANFGYHFAVDPVTISLSGSATAGEAYSLTCSATLFDPVTLPSGVPSPNFQWSFNGSTSLPSGVAAMPTVMSSRNSTSETYSSTLQFSVLYQSHTGNYNCRLGAASLVNSVMVIVIGMLRLWTPYVMLYIDLSFQLLPSLSRSLLVELKCWDKVATPSHVMLMELKISTPL